MMNLLALFIVGGALLVVVVFETGAHWKRSHLSALSRESTDLKFAIRSEMPEPKAPERPRRPETKFPPPIGNP